MNRLIACSFLLVLGACTTAQTAVINAGIDNKRTFEDRKLEFAIKSVCVPSIGAYFRAPLSTRRIAEAACGGEPIGRGVPK